MIKLANLLTEKIDSKTLTLDQMKELLTTKYRDAFKLFHEDKIFYRGHRNKIGSDYHEVRPGIGERISVDDSNIYTVLLGYLPSWRGFPKRSHSLIMSNSISIANEYGGGNVMIVFPANDATVVVSHARDVLSDFAFPKLTDLGIRITDIGLLDDILEMLNSSDGKPPGHYKRSPSNLSPGDYKLFLDDLQEETNPKNIIDLMRRIKNKQIFSRRDVTQNGMFRILQAFVKTRKQHGWNWEKFLDLIFNPELNQFKILPLEHAFGNIHDGEYEMWTDADCLLASNYKDFELDEFAKEIFDK
jgi:hypothetical protein